MNTNDYGSIQNKKSLADSGSYGYGSASRTQTYASSQGYPARGSVQNGYGSADYRRSAPQQRTAYDAAPASYLTRQNSGSSYDGRTPQSRSGMPSRETSSGGNNGAASYRTNYAAATGGTGTKSGAGGNGGRNGGNGNGNGGSNGNGSKGSSNGKKPKKKTFRQRVVAAIKSSLRAIYLFGKSVSAWFRRIFKGFYKLEKPIRIFLGGAAGFVLICVIVIFSVTGTRHKRAEAISPEVSLTTPVPTIAPTATLEPTPSPTPEPMIQKGAEGEDVMALQKRLMELGYLAIDEPTSYFGNATKDAVKLFQRQHELQQDGICGADTINLLNSEEAKPYVMYEGAEGDDIQSFQEQLVELGYLSDDQVTGYYGTDTVSAVTKFQNRNHLSKDGKAGEKTLEAINSPDARVSYTKEQEIAEEKKKQAALARASSAEGRIDKLISIAKKQLGDTYILGKSGPDTFDCSGLVYYCLRQVNVYTRRLNAAGLSKTTSWTKVSSLDKVQRGDLLFFKSDDSSSIGHVGIYIGSGEMIDASSANGKVVRRSAKSSYWRRNFVVARRPIE